MAKFKNKYNKKIYDLCKEKNLDYKFIMQRLRQGWSFEEAINNKPYCRRERKKTDFQKKYNMTLADYSRQNNLHYATFRTRYKRGMSLQQASNTDYRHKGAKPKYFVFYKDKNMSLRDAFRELVKDVGYVGKLHCPMYRQYISKYGSVQMCFDHFVRYYTKKYAR